MSELLAEGEKVSVVWGSGTRQEVKRALIIKTIDKDLLREPRRVSAIFVHYRLYYDSPPRTTTYNDGLEVLSTEGSRWCRGWEGPQVEALKTVVMLSEAS